MASKKSIQGDLFSTNSSRQVALVSDVSPALKRLPTQTTMTTHHRHSNENDENDNKDRLALLRNTTISIENAVYNERILLEIMGSSLRCLVVDVVVIVVVLF